MKSFLFVSIILFSIKSSSQTLSSKKDTLYTSCGWPIAKKDKIVLLVGSYKNGDFKYISALDNGSGWFESNTKIPFKAIHSGDTITVKRIRKYKSRERGAVYILIVHVKGIIPFQCDIEKAIEYGEIVVPHPYNIIKK